MMRVCLICEGCYPYVAGGVSSWIQMLVEEYTEIEFAVWTIGTSREEMGEYKYKLPPNVREVRSLYLKDSEFKLKNGKVRLSDEEQTVLRELVSGRPKEARWWKIMDFLKEHKKHLVEILMGEAFFHICVELYQKGYSRTVFNAFLWNMRSMYFPLMSILSEEIVEADIYHAVSTGYAGVLGAVASYITDRPFFLTEHGIYTREREEEIIKADWVSGVFKEVWIEFFYKLSRMAYEKAELVTTLFHTNMTLQTELGCPAEKIRIIPNGVDFEKFQNLPERTAESREYYNIGVVARVVPIKDIKTMLLSYDMVKRQIPKARLIILGPFEEDEEYYHECLDLIESLSIEDVFFKGRVDITEYLPDFDVMLLTSISEGQPLAVLEGMAAGIPQICTNVGSCGELLLGGGKDRLGEAGMIVPIMNMGEIAGALRMLAKDSLLREEMGDVGRRRVDLYYRKKVFLDEYHRIYTDLKGQRHGRNRI